MLARSLLHPRRFTPRRPRACRFSAAARLAAAAFLVLALWTAEILGVNLRGWTSFAAGAFAIACGWDLLARGLVPWVLQLQPARETLQAVALLSAFCAAFLCALLESAGRLPPELARPGSSFHHWVAWCVLASLAGRRLRQGGSGPTASDGPRRPLSAPSRGAVLGGLAAAAALAAWILSEGGGPLLALAAMLALLVATAPALGRDLNATEAALTARDLRASGVELARPLDSGPLEALSRFVLHKGGILTQEVPDVVRVVPLEEGRSREDVLRLAAAVELPLAHRIARAIARSQSALPVTIPRVQGVEPLAGRGARAVLQGLELACGNLRLLEEMGVPAERLEALRGEAARWEALGETVVFVTLAGEVVGCVCLKDKLRPEAAAATRALAEGGWRPAVVSGDAPAAVAALTEPLGPLELWSVHLPGTFAEVAARAVPPGRTVAVVADRAWARQAALPPSTVLVEWPSPEPPTAARERPPAAVRLPRADLGAVVELAGRLRGFAARRRRASGLAALYHLLVPPLAGGVLWPLGGPAPNVALAAALACALEAWVLRPRRAGPGRRGRRRARRREPAQAV